MSEKIDSLLSDCTLCPRECHADRLAGQRGRCGQNAEVVAARAALHRWEEPCISGARGSGAVFFSGCPLGCIYCQNAEIAGSETLRQTAGSARKQRAGAGLSTERLSRIFLELQEQGAHNINLVTPLHFAPQIAEALVLAKREGLALPVICNCGGYEKVETLRMLEGLVDVYLPDLKYVTPALGAAFSDAPDYFERAEKALAEMVRQSGAPVFDGQGMMQRGVIVRHLVLPGHTREAKAVVDYLHGTYGEQIYVSVMNQYTPCASFEKYPELNRRVTTREYERVVEHAVSIGLENGFVQEGGAASESFIPAFDRTGLENE